jgi:hypothetical protein
MSIRKNIEEIQAKIKEEMDYTGQSLTAAEIQRQAVAAIFGGAGSEAFASYMRFFAKNSYELARLTGPDTEFNNSAGYTALAYLIANGVHAVTEPSKLLTGVGDTLDYALSGDSTKLSEP